MAGIPPARDPFPTSLTPEEFGQLLDAFLDAFSSASQLERVVGFTFTGVDLADIAEGNLRTVTATLIRWAATHNAVPALIAGARKENNGNPRLAELEAYWRNRPARSTARPPGPGTANGTPAVRYLIAAVAVVVVIGVAWWLANRDGPSAPGPWQVETFPPNATGVWYGNAWTTDRNRVQGLPDPEADDDSGFLRLLPQGRLAPASAERSLGDGTADPSMQTYCSLDFRLRLGLDGVNPLPAGTSGAAVYLRQDGEEKAVPVKPYVPRPQSADWQTVNIPRRAFEQAGLDVNLPVSALGFTFAMPMGNTIDIDDIAFGRCMTNGELAS